jgi:hypothetical protein
MDRKASDSIVTAIGIDIGKNTFHLVGRLGRMALPRRTTGRYGGTWLFAANAILHDRN